MSVGPRPYGVPAWKLELQLQFLQEGCRQEQVQAHPDTALLDPHQGHTADGGTHKAFEEGPDGRCKAGFKQALEGLYPVCLQQEGAG